MRINIRDKVIEKGMNRHQFSKAMAISYQAACALYDGTTTRIDFETLESICRVLECTPNEIIVSDDPTVSRLINYQCTIIQSIKSKGDTF